ncbi:MAG: hypothetical protein PHV30_03330 [Candidatus Margulisbacteria bacterium]|nr:hypothetical protein [Candidatus Margulisiibacteriota bacterium]
MSVENKQVGFYMCAEMTPTRITNKTKPLSDEQLYGLVKNVVLNNLTNTGIIVEGNPEYSLNPAKDAFDGSIKLFVPTNFNGDRMFGILDKIKTDLKTSGIITQKLIYDAPDEFAKSKRTAYINFSINPVK